MEHSRPYFWHHRGVPLLPLMHPQSTDGPQSSILVVDDRPDNLRLLLDLLTKQGYEVRCAPEGSLALANIARSQPDLILLDIMMPGLDGYQICRRLKSDANTRHIPIIFISALGEVFDKVKAFEVGGDDYVTKPFQVEEVNARVRHHLEIHKLQRQLQERDAELNYLVEIRTAQLQQSLQFESLLRKISDRVRETLNEEQILENVVRELGQALSTIRCDIGLYDRDLSLSTIRYEYTSLQQSTVGTQFPFHSHRDLYAQLLRGWQVQFCNSDHPNHHPDHRLAKLVCSIADDQGILGDLCISRPPDHSFLEQEVSFVQQVATQCAIAIRQARLFQAAQFQVQQLEKINQLKDEFVATISHELRTPLSNMNLAIKMLRLVQEHSPSGVDPKQQQYLNTLDQECQREIQLVNDLLDLQKLEKQNQELTLTRFSLADWLPQSLAPFQDQFQQKNLKVLTEIAPELPTIQTNIPLLNRVMGELLTNAYKHTPAGQEIRIQLRSTADQRYIELELINTGIEIPPSQYATIFDKFTRLSDGNPWDKAGTGLGLALVKQAVERLGGTISVTSALQQTRFQLHLPISSKAIPAKLIRSQLC